MGRKRHGKSAAEVQERLRGAGALDAAMTAGASAMAGTWYLTGGPDYMGGNVIAEAARFILAERGAPAESIPIHLALKGLGGARKPDTLTVLGWAVFKDVFVRVFDHLDAIEKAAAAAAAVAPPAPAWPGERVMTAEPGPLDAAGGMLRR